MPFTISAVVISEKRGALLAYHDGGFGGGRVDSAFASAGKPEAQNFLTRWVDSAIPLLIRESLVESTS